MKKKITNKILGNILGTRKRQEFDEDEYRGRVIPIRKISPKEVAIEIQNEFIKYYPRFLLQKKSLRYKGKLRYSFEGYKYKFKYTGVTYFGEYTIRMYYAINKRDRKDIYEVRHLYDGNNSKIEVRGPI